MGVFIGLKVSKEDLNNIRQFQEKIQLNNRVKEEDIHCTLLSSVDNCEYVVDNKDYPIEMNNLRLGKIKTQTGVDCLALFFDSQQLQAKYDQIKEQYQIKPFYPELKLHITLSYDCGDINVDNIKVNDYFPTLTIMSEYQEVLKFETNQRNKVRN